MSNTYLTVSVGLMNCPTKTESLSQELTKCLLWFTLNICRKESLKSQK